MTGSKQNSSNELVKVAPSKSSVGQHTKQVELERSDQQVPLDDLSIRLQTQADSQSEIDSLSKQDIGKIVGPLEQGVDATQKPSLALNHVKLNKSTLDMLGRLRHDV